MEKITSLQNARVKAWCRLRQKKERDAAGLFLADGDHLIEEARAAGILETVITDRDTIYDGAETVWVTEAVMHKIGATVSTVHAIGVCRKKENYPASCRRVLLLDGIQDPGNLGTLIRTARSFSFDAVFCSRDTCDLYNEKALRSTQGAMFHIPVLYRDLASLIKELQQDGVVVCSAALDASIPLASLKESEKMAIVLGNEGNGIREAIQKASDVRVRIEMDGFESLNVAVAGGILMYRFRSRT